MNPFRRNLPALRGDFPSDDGESVTGAIGRLPDWDARAVTFTGASGLLPAGGTFIVERAERVTGPLPALRDGAHEPGMFPALPPPPPPAPPPVLAAVPVTEPAVIGDQLRLPVIWCDAAACIQWHYDPDSLGEQDSRSRAIAAGWRTDAFGRLTCPACQQRDPGFRATQPVAWHHMEVASRWWGPCSPQQCICGPGGHQAGENLPGNVKDRLAATAEYVRRIAWEDPALARDLAAATRRHERRAAATGLQRLPAAGWQRGRHAGGVR